MPDRYRGVWQIVQFNRAAYVRALAGIFAALTLMPWTPAAMRPLLALAVGATTFWLSASLVVSCYVYDRSPLYTFDWLAACLTRVPRRWLNLHAGLDESTERLRALFPGAECLTLDVFDAREMTEPSILRARELTESGPSRSRSPRADWRALPLLDATFDAVFLIFAAHELRRHSARVALLREVRRVLGAGGEIVLVEHLRGWANFLAFGPGFLHFFSWRTWRRAAEQSGLTVARRAQVTPFVDVLVLRRRES
jgi:hypothetical protein